jgi:hypothetical protein
MMPSDFLQDMIWSCKGRSVCKRDCICYEQTFSYTELCPCQGSDLKIKPNSVRIRFLSCQILFFRQLDLNSHHWDTAAPIA